MIVQNRPCPDVSQTCSLTLFPSSNIVVVLYAVNKKGYTDYNIEINVKLCAGSMHNKT